MAKPYRIALIGCGLRGVWYLHNLKAAGLNTVVVVLADTDKKYCHKPTSILAIIMLHYSIVEKI